MPRAIPQFAYHVAEAANWPSIQAQGLLPAAELIARAIPSAKARAELIRKQRADHTVLPDGVHIRDQKPMPPAALGRCLVGMTAADWYALVNSRVFFWFDLERLSRQAKACGERPQIVLTIDAPRLVEAYREFASLSPINTGNARRVPARRSAATFVPYASWLKKGWVAEAAALGAKVRPQTHAPVELTFGCAIPDFMQYVATAAPFSASVEE